MARSMSRMDPRVFGCRGVKPLANWEYPLRGSQRARLAGAMAVSAGGCVVGGTGQPTREGTGLRTDATAAERKSRKGSRRIAGAGRLVVAREIGRAHV